MRGARGRHACVGLSEREATMADPLPSRTRTKKGPRHELYKKRFISSVAPNWGVYPAAERNGNRTLRANERVTPVDSTIPWFI